MLNIENINKIVGSRPLGRYLSVAQQSGKIGKADYSDHYEFTIAGQYNMKDYDRELKIFLNRKPNAKGSYDIFCMGLATVSANEVHQSNLRTAYDFLTAIELVLKDVYDYYLNL